MQRELRIPIHAAPVLLLGLVLVSVAPPAGRDGERPSAIRCEPAELSLLVRLDTDLLDRGGRDGATARMRLEVRGTAAPVRVELINRTPGVVALEGGDLQVTPTTGGADNHLERALSTYRAGDFQILYRLTPDPCPRG